jgi:hypothetical protein
MRWAGNAARIGEMKNACKMLVGRCEGKNHLEDAGVDGKVILRRTSKK